MRILRYSSQWSFIQKVSCIVRTRETSPAAKSEEKRMFSQVRTYFLVTCPRLDPNNGITARGCAWMSPEETVVVLIVYILM